VFDAISQYALERLAGFVGKRYKRSLHWGMRLVTYDPLFRERAPGQELERQ
jgi:hypothetical protein